MRVIYLVRTAQLLVTLRALWMLYSVSTFCERTQHTMKACSDMIARIPFATPEQIAEHERIKHLRPASNRMASIKTTSDASTTSHSTTTTTARAPSNNESSAATQPSTEEAKIRQKRDERRMLPGNGMTEAQHKAAVAVEMKKLEMMIDEVKKDAEKVEDTTPVPIKKEPHDEKKEEKKVEVKAVETTPSHIVPEVKKEDNKKQHMEKKEEQKPEKKTEVKAEEKKIDKKEEKKEQHVDKKEDQKPEKKTEVKAEEKKVETTTEAAKPSKNEKKEHLGAKVEIPAAPEHQKTEEQHAEKVASGKAEPDPSFSSFEEKHHTVKKDLKPATGKADLALSSSSSDEKHHTVKKDLKAHVQEQLVEEKKESTTRAPKLAPAQERFVLEHADSFLQEVRCLEVTSDDYFGKDLSPFAQHLKGLAFVGPVLVVIAIYLVCTVLRTRLLNEPPTEFTATLGCVFHFGMWMVVCMSIYFIYNHWIDNWRTVSNKTFMPEFPCAWTNLMLLSSCMMLATSIELWFQKRLNDEIVFERSYRTYEVIESDAGQNESQFERTNVY